MNKLLVNLGVMGIGVIVGCDKGDSPTQTSKTPSSSISMDMPPPSTVEIHDHAAAPKLSVTINGKSYRGVITHDHEHGHAH